MTTRLVERLKSELTPQLHGYLAKTAGESPAATTKAADTAISTLFSGIAAASATPSGLVALSRLVNDPVNDGTLLNQLPALYQGTMTAAPVYRLGSQMLHQVFGGKLGTVNQSIATLAGVKPAAAAALTATLAPHVLAALGRDQRAGGDLSSVGLARLLGVETAVVEDRQTIATPAISAASIAATAAANDDVAAMQARPDPSHGSEAIREAPRDAAIVTALERGTSARGVRPEAGGVGKAERAAGSGVWMIFPVGLALGAGLLGAGSIISNQVQTWPSQSGERLVAATSSVVSAPVQAPPASSPPVQAAIAPAAAVPVTPQAQSAPVVKPATPPPTTPSTPAVAQAMPKPSAAAVPTAAPAPAPIAEPERKPGPPGTTSYFGSSPVADLGPTIVNPDYKPTPPAAPAVAEVAPPAAPPAAAAIVVPNGTPRVSPPGTTTYFGSAPTPPDKAVFINPNYKAPVVAEVAAAAPPPPAPAPKPAQAAAPSPSRQSPTGTTSYFGTGSAGSALPPVFINPDYKPLGQANTSAASPTAPSAAGPVVAVPMLDIPGCNAAVAAAVKSGPVLFDKARATLTRASTITLDRVAQSFKSCAAGKLKVEGHTDDRGSAEYNLDLSEARAGAVVNYLASLGVDKSRLGSEGFGYAKPLVPNSSAANMAKNRRIDFIVE